MSKKRPKIGIKWRFFSDLMLLLWFPWYFFHDRWKQMMRNLRLFAFCGCLCKSEFCIYGFIFSWKLEIWRSKCWRSFYFSHCHITFLMCFWIYFSWTFIAIKQALLATLLSVEIGFKVSEVLKTFISRLLRSKKSLIEYTLVGGQYFFLCVYLLFVLSRRTNILYK